MEQTVLSGPVGHTEWESEPPSPLRFVSLDTDKGGLLPQNTTGQTGLDFKTADQGKAPPTIGDVFQENNKFNLDSLFRTPMSHGEHILQLKGDQPSDSKGDFLSIHQEQLPLTEKPTWLFSPSPTDLLWENSVCEELNPIQDAPVNDTYAASSQGELITLSEPSSPVKDSDRTSDTNNTEAASLLVDLLSPCEHSPASLTPERSGELNPQGVSEELFLLSLGEKDMGLPPSLGGEAVSPETGDKGLFLEPVTDLPITGNMTPLGLPPSCLPHVTVPANCISTLSEVQEGSMPLLDVTDVPDCHSNLSFFPASPTSLNCTDASPDTPAEKLEEESTLTTFTGNLSSENLVEGVLSPLCSLLNSNSSTEHSASTPRVSSDSDAPVLGELPSDCCPAENGEDLMAGSSILSEPNHEEMALDQCLNTGEFHNEEKWDVTPPEGIPDDAVPDLQTEQSDGEVLMHLNLFGHSDCDETDTFDFPAQELCESSPEPGWTTEDTVDAVSLSKMVSDPMHMVSTTNQSDRDVSPLKAVFDALDQDGDGFVRIEEFMEFAAAYGADQVKDLTKFLDPSGLGVISFEDFHRGITAISNGGPEPQLYDAHYSPGDGAVGCTEEYDEQNEVTDSAYLGSESTYSECETFTDEDTGALVPPEMHEEVETDSGIEATIHDADDGSNRFSLNSDLHNHSLVTVIGGEEEHFEDFGESNTSELLLETSMDGTEEDPSLLQTPGQVKGSSLLLSPSAPAPLPDRFQSFLREEALDFFCSQCHKQISRLEDLSTRLNFLEMTSAGKRLSSKKVARHLLQNSSMTLDTVSDLTRDILELADNDITDKVLLLERRVAELEKESEASGEQHTRLRQENLQLVHRANALDEQLKEQELYTEERLQNETRRHKDALHKMERERGLELENLQARLQQLDEENCELRSCVPCLRANIERLEEEKRKLQDETEDMTDRLNEELEARRKMADKLSHERHQSQKEKESTQELIEDLRKQLEHLQLYKLEAETKRGRSPSAGLQEYQTRTREAELEQEIKRLKQDNRSLKEQNDELNGQIINLSIQGAKNLMGSASFSDSLAAEISSVSRGELMEAVHKQEEINYRLQDYIDKIIVAIMECNPSILEVK